MINQDSLNNWNRKFFPLQPNIKTMMVLNKLLLNKYSGQGNFYLEIFVGSLKTLE